MKTARIICGLAAVSWALASWPASAQRVQFATPLTSQPPAATPSAPAMASPSAGTFAPPSTASPYPGPAPSPSAYPPPTLGTPSAGPSPTFGAPGATFGPTTTPSPTFTPSGAAPAATFNGGIQPPPANWDPYATPCNAPSALLPQDPYFQSAGPGVAMGSMTKFLQRVYLDYHWFAGNGENQLGINDTEIGATFALPLFKNIETPFLITPGFGLQLWSGPVSVPPTPADMPPRTYDAFLDTAWAPQINPWLGADLAFRIGIYSDFSQVNANSIRYTGRGLAVVTISPSVKLKAGIFYLDRVKVKMLPAGGLVWTPNPDIYFNILFPNPKVAKRLTTWGTTEWWMYAAGDYGGGTWTVKRNSGFPPPGAVTDGMLDTVDYNDIRVAGGLEFKGMRQFTGYFEVGLSCSRELVYESGLPDAYYPNNTVYLGGGVAY